MCFHFPVMPMLYYALREEKAAPIIDVLADTPAIPTGAQWGTFLRNHDELTLEMVTPEQRAAMYGWYAPDPRMRANVGIRRRLAPLLDNSRPEIELIHALLLSLPGSPVPVLRRRDRHGRQHLAATTAMPCARRCSGPPTATRASPRPTPASSTCRSIQSLVYHYNHVNVEAQMASGSSLPALGARDARGAPRAPGVRARRLRGVRVDPRRGAGVRAGRPARARHRGPLGPGRAVRQQPVVAPAVDHDHRCPRSCWDWETRDLFGGSGFPDIAADGTITITLGSRDFFWLALAPRRGDARG